MDKLLDLYGYAFYTISLMKNYLFYLFCSTFLHLATNVPVLEDTLMRVLVIGLSRELPLGQVDAVELADQLVKRAASLCLDGKGRFIVLNMPEYDLVKIIQIMIIPIKSKKLLGAMT